MAQTVRNVRCAIADAACGHLHRQGFIRRSSMRLPAAARREMSCSIARRNRRAFVFSWFLWKTWFFGVLQVVGMLARQEGRRFGRRMPAVMPLLAALLEGAAAAAAAAEPEEDEGGEDDGTAGAAGWQEAYAGLQLLQCLHSEVLGSAEIR